MKCQHDKYTEKRFAMEDIKRIFNPKVIKYLPIRVYFCEICSAWHITTPMIAMANKIVELSDKINNQPSVKAANKGLQAAYDKLVEKYNNDINDYVKRENNMRETIIELRKQITKI